MEGKGSYNNVHKQVKSSNFVWPNEQDDLTQKSSAFPQMIFSDLQRDVLLNNHLGLASGSSKPTDIDAFKKSYFTQQRVGKGYDSQIDIPSATFASHGSLSQAQNPRIGNAERLKALQELLPQSAEGGRVSALDDLIDYINYLQLQIKDLSESRLVGESPTKPIIFREEYGHYFCDQEESSNEPLEEIITAKWLEQDPSAVSKLLEMKGLVVMPIESTEALGCDQAAGDKRKTN